MVKEQPEIQYNPIEEPHKYLYQKIKASTLFQDSRILCTLFKRIGSLAQKIDIFFPFIWMSLIFYGQIKFQQSSSHCLDSITGCFSKYRSSIDEFSDYLTGALIYPLMMMIVFVWALLTKKKFMMYLGTTSVFFLWFSMNLKSDGWYDDLSNGTQTIVNAAMILFFIAILYYMITIVIMLRFSKLGILWLVLTSCFFLNFLYQRTINSCYPYMHKSLDKWTPMEDSTSCVFKKNPICFHETFRGWSYYLQALSPHEDCSTQRQEEISVYKKTAGKTKIVSLPLVTKLDRTNILYEDNLFDAVHDDLQSVSLDDIQKSDREVFYDFRKDPQGEVIIRLKPIKEEPMPQNERFPSILHISLVGVSRLSFYRNFPKTFEYLQTFTSTGKSKNSIFEFFKLHSASGWNEPVVRNLMFGKWDTKTQVQEKLSTKFKKAGYVTGVSHDYCNNNAQTTSGRLLKIISRYWCPCF